MEDFFKQVWSILLQERQRQAESRSRGELFNMFAACGVNHYENTHSSILAELLNPHGSHGQDTAYLWRFLSMYESTITFQLDKGAEVATEYVTAKGRIDILITNPYRQAIIIENKIYAADQLKQLERYDQFARETYGAGNYEILYLTLNGTKASKQSAGDTKYVTLSYATDIVGWLEKCIQHSLRFPLIRETLIQYQNHIIKLTEQDMNYQNRNELFEAMMAHADESEQIIAAAGNGYLRYVFDTKVLPLIEEFAESNKLIVERNDETNLYIRRKEWQKTAILFTYDGGGHYFGVTCTPNGSLEDLQTLTQQKLDCMDGRPTDWCPYGFHYIKPFEDWTLGTGIITKMLDGTLAKHLISLTQILLKEIDDKNITMK